MINLIGIMLIGYGLLHLPYVQVRITNVAMNYFAGKLHTKIHINGVNVEFFNKAVLEGFYVEDQHHDTLLYAGKLKLSITDFILKKSFFDINTCELDNTYFHLKTYKGEKDLNIQFILNALKTGAPKDTTAVGLKLSCKHLVLNNIDFTLIDENDTSTEQGINFSRLHVKKISGELNEFKMVGDSITTNLHGLSFIDHSGFVLNDFSADITFSPTNFSFKSLTIKTPNSMIKGEYTMVYDSIACINDYYDKVYIKSKFNNSVISFKDLGYFEHSLYDMNTTFKLSGDIKGTISKLKCRNLDIAFGDVTRFKGNVNMDGLPDINNTFIDLSLESLQTNKHDLEKIELPNKKHIDLSENLKDLGVINLSGKFTGFVADFVAYGNLKTALGTISSDINVKYNKPTQTTTYSGKLSTLNFNLGKIIQQEPLLGIISLNAKVKGTAFPLEKNIVIEKDENLIGTLSRYFKKFNADLEVNIQNMDFNSYNYKNIVLNGHASNRQFHGDLDINDENINMNFNGAVDFSKELPVFDFNTCVSEAKLATLNLVKRHQSSSLSSDMSIHFTGNKLDNIYGFIALNNTSYHEKTETLILNKLEINASGEGKIKTLDLKSDIADANIFGEYKFQNLLPVLKSLLGNFIPEYKDTNNTKREVQKFDFSIHIKDANEVTKIFLPQLRVAPFTSFNGSFNSTTGKLQMTGVSPLIKYNKMAVRDFEIDINSDKNYLTADVNCYKFFINDSLWINDVQVSTQIKADSIFFQTLLQNVKNAPNHAKINGFLSFGGANIATVKILPSEIVIDNKSWEINSNNLIDIDTNYLSVKNFSLESGKQKIVVDGKISSNPNDKLNINFSKLNFNNFDELLKTIGIKAYGIINGDANLTGPTNNFHISSNLLIDGLKVNDDLFGDANIATTWDDQKKIVGIVANVANGNVKTIDIHGNYYAARDSNNLDFELNLDQINLNLLNQFIDAVMVIDKDSKGKAAGKIIVKGTPDNPDIKGRLHLSNIGFVFTFLNTHYTFSNDVDVTSMGFYFDNLQLKDDKGNNASSSGSITHKKFKEWNLNLAMNLYKFQMLNTTESMNDLFYGTAYATGAVALNGPIENLVLKVAVKSEKGTQISIPMNNNTDVSESDFITFVSMGTNSALEQKKYEANFGGLQMNFDLEITPEAELQIIFDEKVGDKIKGNGNGNLKMDINTNGNFNMYGDFTVEKGNYLFTFRDLANKPFVIQKGGTILWTGPALGATLNLNAIYSTQAKISDLLVSLSSDSVIEKQSRPVNVMLNLTGNLLSPQIEFGITFPNLNNDNLINETNHALSNKAEINKQAFALLALGYFMPAGGNFDGLNSSSAGYNLSQLLSSQMSNLTGQLIKNVNLGVNYHPGGTLSKQETDLLISTQLFNDRLSIDGNFGYASNAVTNNLVGDFNLLYRITQSGNLQFKAFNKTNSNAINSVGYSLTQGVGLVYRKEFDSWMDWFRKKNEVTKKTDTPKAN